MTRGLYTIVPSPREQQVLELLAAGLTFPQVGDRLLLSRNTVATIAASLRCKFGATNTAMLLVIATRRGFIPEEGSYSCVS